MAKLHPLHTPEMLMDYAKRTGEHYPVERHTGRSTAIALRLMAAAIENPETYTQIRDHYNTDQANEYLGWQIQEMCSKLGLEHMHVERDRRFWVPAIIFQRREEPTKEAVK